MAAHVREATEADFEQVVIEGSKRAPVIVDFWAPWCAPCRALGPVLEKLAAEYGGRFTLVKVNTDENPGLAADYGVRGIPNVKAFVDGELVDEFAGALPEAAVRGFIERVVPSPAEELRRQATALFAESGDAARALELLERASRIDPADERVRIDRAAMCLELGRLEEARAALDSLAPLTRMEEPVKALAARLELAEGAARAGDLGALERRVAQSPADLEARLELANLYAARRRYREALDQLLEIVRRDRGFRDDIGRRTMLDIFTLLGRDELVDEYRRKLASALY